MNTHYDTLQINRMASPEAIKAAYRQQCQKWHPDKNPDNYTEAERLTKIINGAYEVLSDPMRRRQYDAGLAHHQPIHKTTSEEVRHRAAQQAKRRAAEHAQRWAAEEFQRRTADHTTHTATRKHHPQNSLLARLKFAFNFLCILCVFSWVVVMFLTA